MFANNYCYHLGYNKFLIDDLPSYQFEHKSLKSRLMMSDTHKEKNQCFIYGIFLMYVLVMLFFCEDAQKTHINSSL